MTEAVRHLDQMVVGPEVARSVAVGKVLAATELGAEGDGPWAVLDTGGDLLAVYERFRGEDLKPSLVIPPGPAPSDPPAPPATSGGEVSPRP